MDCVFHCCSKVRKSGKKSKHGIMETCATVRDVLRLDPKRGLSIKKFQNLRKMRVHAPSLNAGKRGGYRLIYQVEEMDDVVHVLFLETYFKGDAEDLSDAAYKSLEATAKEIFSNPMKYEWDAHEEDEDEEE